MNKVQQYNKAWAALFTSVLTIVITYFALDVDPVVQAALVTVLTTLAVWAIPNKQ